MRSQKKSSCFDSHLFFVALCRTCVVLKIPWVGANEKLFFRWLVKRWINLVSCVLWTLVPIHYDTPKRNRRSTNFFLLSVAGLKCIYPSREETSNSNYDRYCGNETKKSLSHRHVSRCDRGNYQQTTEPAPVHAQTFDVFGYTGKMSRAWLICCLSLFLLFVDSFLSLFSLVQASGCTNKHIDATELLRRVCTTSMYWIIYYHCILAMYKRRTLAGWLALQCMVGHGA